MVSHYCLHLNMSKTKSINLPQRLAPLANLDICNNNAVALLNTRHHRVFLDFPLSLPSLMQHGTPLVFPEGLSHQTPFPASVTIPLGCFSPRMWTTLLILFSSTSKPLDAHYFKHVDFQLKILPEFSRCLLSSLQIPLTFLTCRSSTIWLHELPGSLDTICH